MIPVGGSDEKEFRLRPGRQRSTGRRSVRMSCIACRVVRHYAGLIRASRCRKRIVPGSAGGPGSRRSHYQRCAVRLMYAPNSTKGQWRAHGRYIARESARREQGPDASFDEHGNSSDIASRTGQWQRAGDERLWKLIISPEFGDRTDLQRLTDGLMKRMEQDLGTQLEWVAVCHFNTDNPHVHVALRGVRDNGQPLSLDHDYVKSGIRSVVENLCTRQLGYRTEHDVIEAQRREVPQHRFTSLDRMIARNSTRDVQSEFFTVDRDLAEPRNLFVAARLRALEGMGLARPEGTGRWSVRRDFGTALRAMQRVADRQKTLASHGVPVSDPRLPLRMDDLRNVRLLEGRVLSHGEDEGTGRSYMMLEGTDAQVHCLYHTAEMAAGRARGGLRANSFIRLRKLFVNGRPLLEVEELGHSERIATDRGHLEETAMRLIHRGMAPVNTGWQGWLGRYQTALRGVTGEVLYRRGLREPVRRPQREPTLSRGR